MEGFMLPFDIHYARERYDTMLAEAETRRLAKIFRPTTRLQRRPVRDKSLFARMIEVLRPRRAIRA
jgi:hypothetical protein